MNFSDIMKQAKEMQAKMQEIQERIANMKVIGEAGGGLVKVVMNGRHDLLKVFIDPSLLQADDTEETDKEKNNKKVLEELVAAAVNDANKKIEDQSRGEMQDLAQDLKLPPGFEDQVGGGDGDQQQ